MIYAYCGPNVTKSFCDSFVVVVDWEEKSRVTEEKQAFQLTSVILHNNDSLIMGTNWACGVLRQWLWSKTPKKQN